MFVVANAAASPAIISQTDLQSSAVANWNGDDAIALRKGGTGGTIIDVIGQIGFDPGTEWGTGLASTVDNTIRRKVTVEAGDGNGADAFDPAAEWDGYAVDTFDGLGAHSLGDNAPTVTASSPLAGATGVAVDANVSVTFSEPVNVTDPWATIVCTSSGSHTAASSGGPTTFTLNPGSDFVVGEACEVTVLAAAVADQDTNDPPNTMAGNHVFSFSTVGPRGALLLGVRRGLKQQQGDRDLQRHGRRRDLAIETTASQIFANGARPRRRRSRSPYGTWPTETSASSLISRRVAILRPGRQTSGSVVLWNGDDRSRSGATAGDPGRFGQVGIDPGAEWGTGATSTLTARSQKGSITGRHKRRGRI